MTVAATPETSDAASAPLAEAFREALKPRAPALDGPQASFIAQVLEDYVPDELPELGLADLAANFADLWAFAAMREPDAPAIRIAPVVDREGRPLGRNRLEVVQDDTPFLVDSLMGEFSESRMPVRAMFHAVVETPRNSAGVRVVEGEKRRESIIQVILDPLDADQAGDLIGRVRASLSDVRAAVQDFTAMRAMVDRAIGDLETRRADLPAEEVDEYQAFLEWMKADHFIFLGARLYQYPRTADGGYAAEEPLHQPEGSLGVLRDQAKAVLRRTSEPAVLTAQLRGQLDRDTPLIVAKSNLRSRVHRRAYMDYIGVRHYGADGIAAGEIRFVGLFTSEAYDRPLLETPLLRRKAEYVLRQAGMIPGGYSDRRLRNILANYPRDELFQIPEDELLANALAILHLYDRPRVRLIVRRDPFDRFLSLLLFLPRESYEADYVARAGQMLARAYGGRVSAYYPSFSDAPLAYIHYIIGVTPGAHPEPDEGALETALADAAQSWESKLDAALRDSEALAEHARAIAERYADAFPAGYRDLYDAREAIADILQVERLSADAPIRVRAYRREEDPATSFRFKLYRWKDAAPLADVLPILDNMGLKALVEEGFPITRTGDDPSAQLAWIHEFLMADAYGEAATFEAIKPAFEAGFAAVWSGRTENDGFNRLVVELGLDWRKAALLRALARWRQQSGLDPSQQVQEAALRDHPEVARLILELFEAKFDPGRGDELDARRAEAERVFAGVTEALQAVESLDADRVLRRMAALVQAMTRTNYYQPGADGGPKGYISFKVASRLIADLPEPKPFREIFVWAPHVEGVHLRFGPVARGGLRWSDRRDDFRTEVLGLVKAQQVKNAVIVPVGSKGGFYPKQLPRGGAGDAIRTEAVRAYRTFLFGLLDLTDNIAADGTVLRPDGVVAFDEDDPYLVVAADKGTATFSDIANAVAEDYGFWLGDAFASGGSAGYDHKAMGITARGAWEAVKRHFRELGKDIQAEPFTVVGVGDMSGDVFGNGMLLSNEIKLIAAFDHRDIFIDPDPDPATAFAERQRLFDLPRSSWVDYDAGLISKGGGVFSRTLKSVPISPEMAALLDIKAEALTPAELIHAVLKARAELLYLGGIGTYVKAPHESQADAGDKANDAIRVDATELRVLVVGEGANLGVTQAGRIAFARAGGRIDTDAIDNSAGVDTSDHEVNIKILTGMAERVGKLDRPGRDALLQSMTDEVAAHVLRHNYDQTLALSLMEREGPGGLEACAEFMTALEEKGRLDRALEGLPSAQQIAERAQVKEGLARPELAVILAYGKIDLFDDMIAGRGPDDPYFLKTLEDYFPEPLGRFSEEMKRHRLRREIIATVVGNDLINLCGATFPRRLCAAAECDASALMIGFAAAKEILRLDQRWAAIAGLDGQIPAKAQLSLFAELGRILRAQTYWMARRAQGKGLAAHGPTKDQVAGGATAGALIDAYQRAEDELRKAAPDMLSTFEQRIVERRAKAFVREGAPEAMAQDLACLGLLTTGADLADLARRAGWEVEPAARIYHQLGAQFGFDRLRAAAGSLTAADSFERLAVRRLIEDLLVEQTELARSVMDFAGRPQAGEDAAHAKSAVKAWTALRADAAKACEATLRRVEAAGESWSFAKLTIAAAALRELAAAAR